MDSGKFPSASESLIPDMTNRRSTERDIAVVEGCDHAQEGGAVPTQLGLNQSEHQFPQETVEGRCLLL